MLELVRDHCTAKRIGFAWHTGSVPQQKRREDINRFKQDPDCRVFLTTDAGATGLNLQVASIVVNCDLPWNPARLEQRIARAWRKFQTQAVTVINLISEGTIESRMLETLATKRSIAESVLDRTTDVTSIILRKPSKDAAERLRQLTGQSPISSAAATAKPAEPPRPRDVTQEFAARLQQRLGTQLVACEERVPVGGGPIQIIVVSEHVAHARAPWMDTLRDEFFPSLEGNPPSHQVDILDRATFDAIERLVKAGLLQRTDTARRDLLDVTATPSGPPPLTPEEEARMREATARAERCLRRAQVLGNADFPEEAITSLRDALLPMATARAIRERWPLPAAHADLLADPWPARWSKAFPALQQLLNTTAADPLPDWRPIHTALVGWMG
jgi:hypothetical protein